METRGSRAKRSFGREKSMAGGLEREVGGINDR
jgi:hypothetical protein